MPSAEPSAAAVFDELERVLASPGFVRNERLGKLLRFLVEQRLQGTAGQLKETLIGIEFFERKNYDPKEDSTVRTEAARLGSRLSEYYAEAGSHDALVIELPKGGYAPVIHVRGDQAGSWRWRGAAIAAAVVLVSLTLAAWWLASKPEPSVIAVLPFKSLSAELDNEYFTDGLTDQIIQNLSILDGLQVRSRTSSFAVKDKPRNLAELGAQLKANYIVEGSVLRSGEKLRVSAQLVRVADDFPLWSGHWDRQLKDIFTIEDEISRSIVNGLRLKLGRGRRRYNTDAETYALYLRARALLANPLPKPAVIEALEQVIDRDPAFAPAYASLAEAYAGRSQSNFDLSPIETYPRIRAAAEKAIALDPLLADAYVSMGLVYSREPAWKDAEKAFRNAIELDPNLSDAWHYLGMSVELPLGRLDDALRDLRKAQEIDPLSDKVRSGLTLTLIPAGRYIEAEDVCRRILAGDPRSGFANQLLGRVELHKGNVAGAIAIFDKLGEPRRGFLGYAYAVSGRRAEAEQLAAGARFPNHMALIYAGLGDKDRTFEALEQMAARKDPRVYFYLYYPELALIRGDPRLKEFRKKIGLPQ